VDEITRAILIISLVAVSGLLIGSVRVRGIGVGPAGVLFAGILFGHFGAAVNPEVAEFTKEFGLILFVFTIGIQLGPGIVQLWKKQGIELNAMAISIVGQGFLIVCGWAFLLDLQPFAAAGLFSGATTNTPSLGAAQQVAVMLNADESSAVTETLTAAYAVAYPGGILGIIGAMLLIRRLCKVSIEEEAQQIRLQEKQDYAPVERRCITIDNNRLDSIAFGRIPGIDETGVRISRIKRSDDEDVHAATDETIMRAGDVIQVVGTREGLDRFTPLLGQVSDIDLMKAGGDAEFRRIFVTAADALNRPLRELSLDVLYNVTVTRIVRAGVEMPATGRSRFSYGDVARIVGDRESLDRVTEFLGNSGKSLKETPFSPLFIGITLGVLAGMIPLSIPGVPFPVRLGLAGGPLIAAIILSLIGNVGPFIWYIPRSANLALRELGIILFLACAGLSAGGRFFYAAMSMEGLKWMVAGLTVTMIPLLSTGLMARFLWRKNYLTICGVVAGSMTDPPALAFANSLTDSEAASTAYAAVYPLTMILRIIAAQAIVFLFV